MELLNLTIPSSRSRAMSCNAYADEPTQSVFFAAHGAAMVAGFGP